MEERFDKLMNEENEKVARPSAVTKLIGRNYLAKAMQQQIGSTVAARDHWT